MLHKSFISAKCKTALRMAYSRSKFLKNSKEMLVEHLRRELAHLLKSGQDQTARIRVEIVVREEKMMVAYELIENFCELIHVQMHIIESQMDCPKELKEAVASVVFASSRCPDIPGLGEVRKHFKAMYGKKFVSAAEQLHVQCGVNLYLVEQLSAKAPDGQKTLEILTALAEEHNIKWDPKLLGEKDTDHKKHLTDMLLMQDSDFISNPLIGVEQKVEELETLLQVGVSDIRIVGIYGTGGIGKTTLAKLVFDRLSTHFAGSSFVEDTRKITLQHGGLRILQIKLTSDILRQECTGIASSDEGICFIREELCDMRVLLVLDNVDSTFCLDRLIGDVDSFGPGSRILVTARNKTDLPKGTETYEVLKMNDQEAFTLFTTHAFKGSTSSWGINLSDVNHILRQKVLSAIGRIPLAVEVIGSLLSGVQVNEWESTLDKLEDFPDEELGKRLKVSYDALSDQQKQIFLDVACFINGEDSRISSYMWHDFVGDTVLSEDLKGLISLSLVKIGDNNELLMHDELREIVRELICQEEFSETEEMNRFLIQVRDFAALLAEKDLGRVEALDLCFNKLSQYQDSDFRKMPSLRFLKVADANMCGDFSDVFSNLRWLHWEGCPRTLKATNLNLKSLVILNLSWSKVTSVWEGWSQVKATKSLKVLNLTGCINLITTPNLSNLPNLEKLILEQCSSLVRIDPSIQCLDKLQFLNLKFCTELTTLPKELGSLKALTEILINGTSVRSIPISIGHLVSLETLSASSCVSLTHLPSSISYLTSLSELTLDGAQIHELSDFIGELKILRKLSLKDCIWMQKLPESIRNLKYSLIQLDVSGTGISEFPNSVQDLQRLEVLKMNSCFIRVFPKAICYLSNLEELHASHCRNLESDIPPEIERLRCLKILRLGFSRISSLPDSIFCLPRLQNLDLDHCNMLSVLPHLPSSLIRLCFNSIRMVKFPSLLHMHNLEELILADSDSEELLIHKTDLEGKEFWIPQLPKLKTMELCRSGIHFIHGGIDCKLLRKLTLSCVNLEFLPLYLPLLTLSVHHCQSLEILEAGSFPCLVELQVLDSAVCCIRHLGSLKALRVLNVSKCQVEDLDGLEKLSSLVMLTISRCKYLQKLPNLSKLVLLRSLAVSYCDSIESLPNLSELEMLKEVEIHCCEKLSEIHGLENLRSLEKLQVTKCEAANLPKDSENEEDIHDEGDDDVEEEHEHENEPEVPASTEPVVKIPVEPSTSTKKTERQLSKKERKKKELAELEARLADFVIVPKDTTAQDDKEVVAAAVRTTGDYPERPGEPECVLYSRTGSCKVGASCRFHHPKHGGGSLHRVPLNNRDYPLRPGMPKCIFYMQNGDCRFGSTCKFDHPVVNTIMRNRPSSASSLVDVPRSRTRKKRQVESGLKDSS